VELVEAELTDGAETLIQARGWRLRSDEVNFETPPRFGPVPPGPDRADPRSFFEIGQDVGYHTAMDYRFVQGAFTESGPATVWMLFINVDLSVHLHRMPEGEWICLDAVTRPEPDGIGIADTRLFDERDSIGRGVQTLLIDERR
jgi:Acyl-CoA thioesterase C-terminal domain